MTFDWQRFVFENSPFDPLVCSLLAGFAVIGLDWQPYLTPAGEMYLESCDAPRHR